MKIIDVIKHKDFHMNQSLVDQSSIKITKDGIDAKLTVAINVNEEAEMVYYWYDHLTRGSTEVNEIEQSLQNKNWELFSTYFYDIKPHKCTLPKTIIVFPKSEEYILGYLDINEDTISLLTWAEYECG